MYQNSFRKTYRKVFWISTLVSHTRLTCETFLDGRNAYCNISSDVKRVFYKPCFWYWSTEACLGYSQASRKELFCRNKKKVGSINYSPKKAPS